MIVNNFRITWTEAKFAPEPPNPAFPNGRNVDQAYGRVPMCMVPLHYPAPCCGLYRIKCQRCGAYSIAGTTGQPDDPRSLLLACRTRRDRGDEQ